MASTASRDPACRGQVLLTTETTENKVKNDTGILYGVGVGPGDPELLTLKAFRLINECDVLAYPAPESGEGLAFEIVRKLLTGEQELLPLRLPINITTPQARQGYDRAVELLEWQLGSGKSVAVICEGDPLFYASFAYIFARLSDRFNTEIVPGVASPMAAASALKTTLASGGEVLTILPGTLDESVLERRLQTTDAAVIIKVGRHFQKINRVLKRLNLEARAKYIEHATLPEQKIVPLEKVGVHKTPYFSIILVRK